ncbi:hypothetical protein DPMN_139145 [Dreissena polymorpha]|uniref:Uncharacterized protein n=1 Tax=Dreissena polymorpha TaxID=45954 RepID=A0A9D4G8L6_DREPO|nr:hypothetical protein DPMN_139145 [Dreissena polymorpha]
MIMPKAITGAKYREWLAEKEAKKQLDITGKRKCQEERLHKKQRRVEELKEKKRKLERKQREREQAKKRIKELKIKKSQETDRIL